MGRVIRHIEGGDTVGCDAFALHLVHQAGEAFGKIVKRRAGKGGGFGAQQAFQQDRKLQPPAQGGKLGGQRQGRKCPGDICDQQKPGPKARARVHETFAHPPPHPLGVQDQRDPGECFGRVVLHAVNQARDQFGGEIHAGRQGEKVGGGFSHLRCRKAGVRPERCRRGGPRRTSRRHARCHKPGQPR